MTTTPNLQLPLLAAGQAQKHVTLNEALAIVDGIAQLCAQTSGANDPPSNPATGERHLVGPSPTGAWAGRALAVATWDGGWDFVTPRPGWTCYVIASEASFAFTGSAWRAAPSQLPALGVNAAADATNRLTVAAAATLLNHDGGSHRLTINKAAPGQTGSLLFQTAFSGRAEIGLAGDDRLSMKVSGDGTQWRTAMQVEHASARVSFPGGGVREVISAPRTYFVSTAGSDTLNDGLSSTAPFATVQRAIDAVWSLDLGSFDATIQLADGAYVGAVQARGTTPGTGVVTLRGNLATPQSVTMSADSQDVIRLSRGAVLKMEGVTLAASGGGASCVVADSGAIARIGGGVRFGAATLAHLHADQDGAILFEVGAAITITGGAGAHLSTNRGRIAGSSVAWTLSGTPVFGTAFATAAGGGLIDLTGASFSGPATGSRYQSLLNAVINTRTGNAAFFPGSVAGTIATGGQYA
jgi:hypothetical protein